MTVGLFLTQALNGLQLGVLLFLLAAGLTLVFGIMNFVNLAHGSLYMMGAYFAATVSAPDRLVRARGRSSPFRPRCSSASSSSGWRSRGLYRRDHLDQVLATFGLILFFNELVRIIWGTGVGLHERRPQCALRHRRAVRLALLRPTGSRSSPSGLAVARRPLLADPPHAHRHADPRRRDASADRRGARRQRASALNTLVFGLGAGLAGLAGLMAGPILSVQPGMGEPILILTLVVIVTGGIGSIRGAFYGALHRRRRRHDRPRVPADLLREFLEPRSRRPRGRRSRRC